MSAAFKNRLGTIALGHKGQNGAGQNGGYRKHRESRGGKQKIGRPDILRNRPPFGCPVRLCTPRVVCDAHQKTPGSNRQLTPKTPVCSADLQRSGAGTFCWFAASLIRVVQQWPAYFVLLFIGSHRAGVSPASRTCDGRWPSPTRRHACSAGHSRHPMARRSPIAFGRGPTRAP